MISEIEERSSVTQSQIKHGQKFYISKTKKNTDTVLEPRRQKQGEGQATSEWRGRVLVDTGTADSSNNLRGRRRWTKAAERKIKSFQNNIRWRKEA